MAISVFPFRPKAFAERLIFIAFLLAGLTGLVLPYFLGDRVPGDLGDARLNRFILEHFFSVLIGNADSFVDPPLFYPWPDTIGFSETLWGAAPIYSLFRASGFNPEHAFAAWFATGFLLNYVSAYAVLRRLGLTSLGAAAGAFLFSFGLPVTAQDGHAQLLYRVCVPWAVWALYRYAGTRDAKFLALLALFVALQFLISFYIGVFLILLLLAYFAVLAIEWRPPARKSALRHAFVSLLPRLPGDGRSRLATAALAISAALILGLAALPYVEVERLYGFRRNWVEITNMLPRPLNYLVSARSDLWSWIAARLVPVPGAHENQMFFGLAPLLCVGTAAFSLCFGRRDQLMRHSLCALGILVVITLKLDGVSLYVLLYQLPGFSAIRVVTRIVLVMLFPVAIITGRVLELGWEARTRDPLYAVAFAGSLLLVIEALFVWRSTSSVEQWHMRLEAMHAKAARPIGEDSILVAKGFSPFDIWSNIDAMLLAQSLNARTLNGYSGNFPPGWKPMQTCTDIIGVMQRGEDFRRRHRQPELKTDKLQVVPIGFGDCGDALDGAEAKVGTP